MYLDISRCVRGLCSDPSPPPSREWGMDHSLFKVSLSSLSHHTILWGRARGSGTSRQDWLFIHPSPPLFLSSFSFPFPLHVSGARLALFDLKTFVFYFTSLCFSHTWSIYMNCSPVFPSPSASLLIFLSFHPVVLQNRSSPREARGKKGTMLLLVCCFQHDWSP